MSLIPAQPTTATGDIVFIDSIDVSANIGADWWGRERTQPLTVSVHLHLQPSYLDRAGETDDVRASVHYGHLCKNISLLVNAADVVFDGARGLAAAVTRVAFEMAGTIAAQIVVVVASSKAIPLARGFALEMTTPVAPATAGLGVPSTITVSVSDVVLPAIIGVNSPERIAKQRVITTLTVSENMASLSRVDYLGLVAKVAKDIEASSHLTLEKFALEIVRTICLSSDAVDTVTVRAGKPSALSYAEAAGVQITRPRSAFVGSGVTPMVV